MGFRQSAYFYLFLTVFLWSAQPAIAKIALKELDNYQLLFYTAALGALVLFLLNAYQNKLKIISSYSASDLLKMFAMGALGVFLYHVFLYRAYSLAPAGQVNVVNYLWPVFIVIFSIPILKEKYNTTTFVAIFISFFGALVAFTHGNLTYLKPDDYLGYVSAAVAAVCYGLFSVLGKKLHYDKMSSIFIYYLGTAAIVIPFSFLTTGIAIPQSPDVWIAVLLIGGLINSVCFYFWFKALQHGDTHRMANLIYAVPFLAMAWTFFLNGEPFSIFSLLGLVLIIIGISLQLNNNLVGRSKG